MNLSLLRDTRETYCTLGIMEVGGHKLNTIERPWIQNPDGGRSGKRFESCIAPGIYRLEIHRSEKFGNVWALVNPALDVYHWPGDVPRGKENQARVAILIHAANHVFEVLGCIAPGKNRVRSGGQWMVTASRDALNLIKTVIGNKLDLTLTIAWVDGVQPTMEV